MSVVIRAPRRIKRVMHPLTAWQHPHNFEIKTQLNLEGKPTFFIRTVVPSDGTSGLLRGEWTQIQSPIGLWNKLHGLDKPEPTNALLPTPKFESVEEAVQRGVEIKKGPKANSLDPEAQVEHRIMAELRKQWRKLKMSGKLPESKLDALQSLIRRNRALRGLTALDPQTLSARATTILAELRVRAIDELAREREATESIKDLVG